MRENHIKKKLTSGQPVFGVIVGTPDANITEMMGYLGFDWVLIDAEHGPINENDCEAMVRACELAGITSVVRPPVNRPEVLLRFMDRGAEGVQVPHVNTKADAQAVVEAVKYYPLGKRGFNSQLRLAQFGLKGSAREYLEAANRETFVCVMIEEVEAVHNLGEILEVDGIDVYFVGPGDLSQSMGYPGQRDVPEVHTVVRKALDQIIQAGKVAGVGATDADVPQYLDMGVKYFHASVTNLLRNGSQHYFQLAQGAG